MSDTLLYGTGITFILVLLAICCEMLIEIRDLLEKLVAGRGQSGD